MLIKILLHEETFGLSFVVEVLDFVFILWTQSAYYHLVTRVGLKTHFFSIR
jgi:hypothetical protein